MTATISGSAVSTLVALTTTGNTILGDASTDTLNVGNGDLVKDASGNVGIGTTSLTEKFEVSGSVNSSGQSTNFGSGTQRAFMDYTSGTTTARFGHLSGASGSTTGVMAMFTNGAERARIDSSGNLLVGTTTTPVGNNQNGHYFYANGGYNSRTIASNRDWGISVTSGSIINFYSDNGSTAVFAGSINVNGNTTAYTSVSDYRLKENVQPMVGALARVQQLKPVTFVFKDGGQLSEGFVAHELQAVVPDCVTGTKDAVDSEGKPQYQSIDTSFLVATLTAAIQEQQALIVQLQADVAALKGAQA